MKTPLIEVIDISKKFKKIIANKNISFNIYKGDNLAIIGANGAGKTTLVEQIIGVSKPTSGKIKYNFKYNSSPQEKMGMQFQDSSYPDGLSVKNIIDFSLSIYKAEIDQKELDRILNTFQIKGFMKKPVKGISGGQQQKLNVLLALIHKPDIVVLDEITTGLDIAAKSEILDFIENYLSNKNKTAIFTSHNMNEVKRLCNRVIVINDARLIADTTPKELIKKYKSLDKYMDIIINGGKDAV